MIYLENTNYINLFALLAGLVTLWVYNFYRQQKLLLLLGEKKLIANLVDASRNTLKIVAFVVSLLALSALIFVLANPYSKRAISEKSSNEPLHVVFVLDISKSMKVKDMSPDRLSRAKKVLTDIIGQFSDQQTGIVLFSGSAGMYVPLTDDYNYLKNSIDAVSVDLIEARGSSIKDALKTASLLFPPKQKKNKVICVLSDGEFHDGKAIAINDSLSKTGIKYFTFGFGTKSGGHVPAQNFNLPEKLQLGNNGQPIVSQLNAEVLKKLAGVPGNYIEVNTVPDAAAIFVKWLDENRERTTRVEAKSYYKITLVFALMLLLIDILIPLFTRKK